MERPTVKLVFPFINAQPRFNFHNFNIQSFELKMCVLAGHLLSPYTCIGSWSLQAVNTPHVIKFKIRSINQIVLTRLAFMNVSYIYNGT